LHSVSVNRIDHDLFHNWVRFLPTPQLPFSAAKANGRPGNIAIITGIAKPAIHIFFRVIVFLPFEI
jgi:hypothetical protein